MHTRIRSFFPMLRPSTDWWQKQQKKNNINNNTSVGTMSNDPADVRANARAEMGLSREVEQVRARESDPSVLGIFDDIFSRRGPLIAIQTREYSNCWFWGIARIHCNGMGMNRAQNIDQATFVDGTMIIGPQGLKIIQLSETHDSNMIGLVKDVNWILWIFYGDPRSCKQGSGLMIHAEWFATIGLQILQIGAERQVWQKQNTTRLPGEWDP